MHLRSRIHIRKVSRCHGPFCQHHFHWRRKPAVWLGPVQDSLQFDRASTFLDDIDKEKWTVATGGVKRPGVGYFIEPTVVDKPDDDSRIVQEEPFSKIHIVPLHNPVSSVLIATPGPLSFCYPGLPKTKSSPAQMIPKWHLGLSLEQ
jgi:hypothetical protein